MAGLAELRKRTEALGEVAREAEAAQQAYEAQFDGLTQIEIFERKAQPLLEMGFKADDDGEEHIKFWMMEGDSWYLKIWVFVEPFSLRTIGFDCEFDGMEETEEVEIPGGMVSKKVEKIIEDLQRKARMGLALGA